MALAVVVTQLVVPQTGSYNLVLLLLPAVLVLAQLHRRSYRGQRLATAGRALIWATMVLLPWLLWPMVRFDPEMSLDLIILPGLVLLVLLLAVIRKDLAHSAGPAPFGYMGDGVP
jgi:hypothetical protein